MSASHAIARPYARAAFAKAREDKTLADWSDFIQDLAILVDNEDMQRLLKAPDADVESILKVIHTVVKSPSREMDNFLTLLIQRKRLIHISVISTLYEELRRKEEGVVAVQVQSALSLTDDQKKSMQSQLAKYFSAGVTMDTSVDPSLVGGVRVRVGDRVWDASIRGCLRHLAQCMSV